MCDEEEGSEKKGRRIRIRKKVSESKGKKKNDVELEKKYSVA